MVLNYREELRRDLGVVRRKRRNRSTSCKVVITQDIRADTAYMNNKWGCKNNAIKSMTLCNAPKHMKITFFDDEYFRTNDDCAIIEVNENMDGCKTILTFEKTKVMDKIAVTYLKVDGLDGDISSFKVEFRKFIIFIQAHYIYYFIFTF